MIGGFRPEVHVVVYCENCGDVYTDHDGHRLSFPTPWAAGDYLAADKVTGWAVEDGRVLCETCLRVLACRTEGHVFPPPTLLNRIINPPPRSCGCCGIHENELTP